METADEKFRLEFDRVLKANLRKAKSENNSVTFYTDGSVREDRAGMGVWNECWVKSRRLRDETSIFTCELEAIREAVKKGRKSEKDLIVICTDSLSAIQAIQRIYAINQTVLRVKELIQRSANKTFLFIWVPSHKGIEGNENADALANAATEKSENKIKYFPLTKSDYKLRIKRHIREKINNWWRDVSPSKNKLREIRRNFGQCRFLKFLKRVEAVKITRLRLGHTRLTHDYLMNKEDKTICECGDELTVKHIFHSCPRFRKTRKKFKIHSINVLQVDSVENYKNIIRFIKKIKIYHEI